MNDVKTFLLLLLEPASIRIVNSARVFSEINIIFSQMTCWNLEFATLLVEKRILV